MARMIGTGRMNRSGGSGTLTVPVELADEFDLDNDGVDVIYVDDEDQGVRILRADEVNL
jgi:hypothetical protein